MNLYRKLFTIYSNSKFSVDSFILEIIITDWMQKKKDDQSDSITFLKAVFYFFSFCANEISTKIFVSFKKNKNRREILALFRFHCLFCAVKCMLLLSLVLNL